MGKGQIVSGGTDGQYQVKLIYAYRSRVEQKILKMQQNITSIEGQITTLDTQISVETDIKKKEALILRRSVLNLQKTSIQKQITYYQNNMPADPTVSAWCMDSTENLSGNVGTAEIPGEPSLILIRPGYSGRATYNSTRDGQLMPSIAGEPNQVLFNWMLLPGWQRHKPIYRIGTIIPDSLDFDANTCSVCLEPAYSSQQSLPAIDGATVSDCNMGNDTQSNYLTNAASDFCSRNPSHPFCIQSAGSEINLTDAMLAQLREANYYVNSAYGRQNDKSGIIAGDHWDVMSPGGSGDCEDFALTKMQKLVDDYGWNPNNLNIVTAYAKKGEYHAMLGVRTTNRGLVVLDVNYNEVMESGRVPYRIDKVALTSNTWKNYARRMDNVPIEYMECDASAFADNDRIIIEFQNQSWSSPKVVGFLENPNTCGLDAWMFGTNNWGATDYSHMRWDFETDSWITWGEIPGYVYIDWVSRDQIFVSGSAWDIYLFGGGGRITGIPAPWDYDQSDRFTGGAWVSMQAMPTTRMAGFGFKLGSKHYVVSGGQWEDNWDTAGPGNPYWTKINPFSQNWEFDSGSDSWVTKNSHSTARAWSRAFTLFDLGFCFGGTTETPSNVLGQVLTVPDDFVAYNQSSETWITKQSMIRGRNKMAVGAIGGKGYVFQGQVRESALGDTPYYDIPLNGYWTEKIDKYNPNEDSWNSAGELTVGSIYHCSGAATSGNFGFGFFQSMGLWDSNSDTFTSKTNWAMTSSIEYLDFARA